MKLTRDTQEAELAYWRTQPGIEEVYWDEYDDYGHFVESWLLLYQVQPNGEKKCVFEITTF
jgi:hypothetical protein